MKRWSLRQATWTYWWGMPVCFLQASERRVAVLVDGFISGAAALAALRMDPSVSRALFCVHKSAEAGGAALLEVQSRSGFQRRLSACADAAFDGADGSGVACGAERRRWGSRLRHWISSCGLGRLLGPSLGRHCSNQQPL